VPLTNTSSKLQLGVLLLLLRCEPALNPSVPSIFNHLPEKENEFRHKWTYPDHEKGREVVIYLRDCPVLCLIAETIELKFKGSRNRAFYANGG
jgi:hypothetical protein